MSAKWWLLPMAFLLLPACAPAASTARSAADPTPSAAPPAATATPAATPDPTATPAFDPNTLDYDEIRNVAVCESVPSAIAEGYFTVSKDDKWGLIRADGTELLPCLADAPVRNCGAADHWLWNVQMSWEELNTYNERLWQQGERGICSGHGGVKVRFVYDLDAPGRDIHAYDPWALRAYVEPDGPGTFEKIAEEMWETYGEPLPICTVHEVQEVEGGPSYPSDPVIMENSDGGQIIYQFADRKGLLFGGENVQLAGFFFDEPLAPVQKTNGKWAYYCKEKNTETEAVYDATYDIGYDEKSGEYTDEPLYAAHLQNGYAAVCRDGAWGLLGPDGSEIIPCEEQGVAWEGTALWIKDDAGWHETEVSMLAE